ncbi:hypothetical protein ACCS63_35805, partial [Rhizobium brockwellii]|uniref:hypothetical protein n=1 Tax=Rhizobium brockwellii TaxID=3019932 RepID=UPI003F98B439
HPALTYLNRIPPPVGMPPQEDHGSTRVDQANWAVALLTAYSLSFPAIEPLPDMGWPGLVIGLSAGGSWPGITPMGNWQAGESGIGHHGA